MKGITALLLLGGSLIAVVGAGRTWLTVQVQDPVLGRTEALVTGASVTGAVTAAGLLGAAAGLVVVLTRGAARRSGLVLALAAGGWLVWIGVRVALDPLSAARSADLGAPGRPGAAPNPGSVTGAGVVTAAELSAWPLLVALAGLVVVGGVVTGLLSGRRPTAARVTHPARSEPPGRKHRAAPAERQEVEQRRAARDWDELSAGHDPTDDGPPEPPWPPKAGPSPGEPGAGPRDS